MSAAIKHILIVVGLLSYYFLLAGQNNLPASQASHAGSKLLVGSGESTTRTLEVEGKVTSVKGEPLAGATVWAASFASPMQHLAETKTDIGGDYYLKVIPPLQRGAKGSIIVGANHPECMETQELLDLKGSAQASKITLLLRRLDESLDGPSLDLIKVWLLPRLARSRGCRRQPGWSCRSLDATLAQSRNHSMDWATLEQILQATRQADLSEFRVVAALALMQMGSWEGAGSVLASHAPEAKISEEEFAGISCADPRRPDETWNRRERLTGAAL
jgi:hypothetical protein